MYLKSFDVSVTGLIPVYRLHKGPKNKDSHAENNEEPDKVGWIVHTN